jgi:hypothetical protein
LQNEALPDPYAMRRIGLKKYYEAYEASHPVKTDLDTRRELYMARRLKELSLRHEKVLFIGGMHHVQALLKATERNAFPDTPSPQRILAEVATLSEASAREVPYECGFIAKEWEAARNHQEPDRQKLWLKLLKEAKVPYEAESGAPFAGYHLKNIMKFARNWAFIKGNLLPDIYQLVIAAKGCTDNNFAYHVWKLATENPYLKNIDALREVTLTPEEVWGGSKKLHFRLKGQRQKGGLFRTRKKDSSQIPLTPISPFSLCSYPPEDVAIENFGEHLKKRGVELLSEEGARTLPFSCSLEDGIDTRETLRHRAEKTLYVKTRGKPPGDASSVVVIFDEDNDENQERFPWKTTWIGEHSQESDMAFYATPLNGQPVGPGISRSLYGGFMLSSPPRRLLNVWDDPDYFSLNNKAEVLLAAAIDYAVKPIIVYVAKKAPRTALKNYAARWGKKVIYIPLGQLSPVTLQKLRAFHVLDSHSRRGSADDYIF